MRKTIDKLLQRFIPSLNDHLSDDRIASLFCHELPFVERIIAKRHLAKCWHCRLRQEELEGPRAEGIIDLCRERIGRDGDHPLLDQTRVEFVKRLRLQIQQTNALPRWAFHLPSISRCNHALMNPTFAIVLFFGFVTAISLFMWQQQRAPRITSSALLERAEKWNTCNLGKSSCGVVYQVVRITTSFHQAVNLPIYRDLQGKRKPRRAKLADDQEKLMLALAQADVEWDEPISASDYQIWHDRHHDRVDKIARAGSHLLKLTTTVPSGAVSSQSLIVRDTDFHPVRRTVEFRNSETIDIAELDYKILPWAAVDASVFEPLSGEFGSAAASSARILPFPRIPDRVSEEQLDEAELEAKLILNQLHADTGEQIEIHRKQQEIEVAGVVETNERKQALQAQLSAAPHVSVSIQSADDLKNARAGDILTSIKTASMPEQRPPLEIYLQARGHSVSESNMLSQGIFNAAFTIDQESKAITDLRKRFGNETRKSIFISATLSELIYSHRERLESALQQERKLLAKIHALPPDENRHQQTEPSSLLSVANRNLALAKELTESSTLTARRAEEILAEMPRTAEDLKASARYEFWLIQGKSTLSERK